MADKSLNIPIRVKGSNKAKQDLKKVDNSIVKMGKSAVQAGAAFFAASGIINGFKNLIDLTATQELAEKKLEASLGRVSEGLLSQASALQRVSMFGDEQIIEAQALIAAFVGEEEAIAKATKATIDLAAAKNMDLTAAADLVSKTLGSSTNAMSRYGIEVTGAVGSTERLDSLIGNVADKFGGQAAAQTETLAGAMRQLEMAIGDAGEEVGEHFAKPVADTALALQFIITQTSGFKDNLSKMAKDVGISEGVLSRFASLLANLVPGGGALDVMGDIITVLANKQRELNKQMGETANNLVKTAGPVKEVEETISLTADEAKKLAQFTAQTSTSLITSAMMGDNLEKAFKRALTQQILITAQLRLQQKIQETVAALQVVGSGPGAFIVKGLKFLFGASPTQASPSPNITINQTIQGGVIDHNFAANSIIPAINKAISTGQARINR